MKAIILSVVLFFVTFSNVFAAQQATYVQFKPYRKSVIEATAELNNWIKENEKTKKVVSFQFLSHPTQPEIVGVWILYEDVPFKPVETGKRSERG
jgi:hypothetical protein